jgi:tetratricopeptide (TPR) repeat protein
LIIHRKAGRTPIDATRFRSWADLAAELGLERDDLARRCVFSDVSLGAWRGHWIGRELYAQLGLAFPDELQPRMGARETQAHSGGYFGELTDNEARGDFNVLLAYRAALDILTEMQRRGLRWIILLAPIATAPGWGAENLILLRFLAQGCEEVGCRVRVVVCQRPVAAGDDETDGLELRWHGSTTDDPPASAPTELGMFPGVIPSSIVETSGVTPDGWIALPDGRGVLSPALRGAPPGPVRAWLMQLAVERLGPAYEWLQGYAVGCEERDPTDADAAALLSSAIERFSEGGHEIALRLLEQAKRRARSPRMRAASDLVRQHVLLRLRDFQAATSGPLPTDDLPPPMRLGLLQSKGWAFTMMGKAAEAEPFLEQARGLTSAQTGSRAYLYLLNISALNQLRLGRFDSALAMEKTIEQALAAASPTDWHATYINSINQARLYKKGEDLATAERYYRRAFTIIDGVRSDGDLLYHGLCFAQLEAKHGNDRAALMCWLRAALHWLSAEIPEALAPRVVEAVTLGRRVGSKDEVIAQVSAGLRAQLRAAWTRANGAELDESPVEPPAFVAVDAVPRHAGDRAIGADGFGLFVRAEPMRPRFSGDEYLLLSRDVWRCVRALAGLEGLPETCTVLTDNRFGSDLPTNLDELVSSCLRVGVTTLVFGGRPVDVSDQTLVARARVSIVPGVDQCRLDGDAPTITFKRYRKPLALTLAQATLLRQVTDTSTVASLAAEHGDDVLAVLRALESQHVLRISVSLLGQ